MDHQPGRLVDHQQMLVLVDDDEGDILRLIMRGGGIGDGEGEGLAAAHLDRRIAMQGSAGRERAALDQHLQPLA